MNFADYVLDVRGKDWAKLLSSWSWLLTDPFSVRLANRFGDLFLARADGSIHFLDIGLGEVRPVAASEAELLERLGSPESAAEWLYLPLVNALREAGQVPVDGYCYSYVQLPVFGGEYEPANIIIRDLAFHYGAFGPIHERIKDLPDGAEVTFKVQP